LLDGAMRARFHAEPMVQATELLLQEGTPRDVAVVRPWAADAKDAAVRQVGPQAGRRLVTAHNASLTSHLLSNGQYAVMLTAAGSGYSRWRGIAVTRWREDATSDDWGSYVYLRDVGSGEVWSAGFQPSGTEPDTYEVMFNEDRAEFTRHDGTLATTLEVLVSGESDAEVRRVSITNSGNRAREIDVTSYAELVLAAQADDVAHPAFMKLFVATEYLADLGTILATRRRRSPTEQEVWAAHLAIVDGEAVGKPEVETDRARFLGRGHGSHRPIAVVDGRPLSNTVGTVLDPVFALRHRVRVAPGAIVRIAFWTVIAESRAAVLDLVDKHRDTTAFERAGTLAWTQAQVQLHHLGIDPGEAGLFQRLAGHLLHAGPSLRPSSDTIRRGAGAQPGLWPMSISGDLPIALLRIADVEHLDLARQLLQAHEYWRMKQLAVDLVILNERAPSYVQDLQIALETLVRASQSSGPDGVERRNGSVFVLRADLLAPEARALLASVARVVLVGQRGSLADQLNRVPEPKEAERVTRKRAAAGAEQRIAPPPPGLEFFNGLGGFAADGREYVTILGPGQSTPAPWINVIANPDFGFQVSAEGSGFTWSVNSRENQLTPWSNDPVSDRPGEVFYLRDDDTGDLWCPTALPIRDHNAAYVARHGWGYSRFEHSAYRITAELVQYVPLDNPIKISRLTLSNTSNRTRHLSVTAYAEWVLGTSRTAAAPFVTTEIDAETGAMFARNPWSAGFGSRVAFADLRGRRMDWTGDRREFLGRNGTLENPAALASAAPFSNTVGAGLDPCAALRTTLVLPANARVEIVFFLGEATSAQEARRLITRYRTKDLDVVLSEVGRHWDDVLGAVQVKTPDRAMDIVLNGWLLYQTLSCRIWARSAFYQASGAYGFRDQLQDGMALTAARPALTREHLLRAAARQFVEGDVQHWWLPHSGQGVRTRISDDRAWLAYAVAHYVGAAGDAAVLDAVVPFLDGQLLRPEEHDSFFQPMVSDEVGTLFEHCARGLDASLKVGLHGLPLMGTGDWNDGMNRVGELGQGESVWLGWLLYATLCEFAPLAEARGDTARAATWRAYASTLQAALESEAWDGDWYRRAWFDDGTPLGSATDDECRIDAISQSWAAISGAADAGRAARAMAAVERELIRPADGLALLFTPPFDKTALDPGYIKGYPPGIRENGGQYTHAALWSVLAFAMLGEGDKAAALFSLLNPINHARTRADVHRYKVEPYVIAADVYAAKPHVGRGGWTWYTGSGGWMQRAGIEGILGLRLRGDVLELDPCIPKSWPGFAATLRYRSARYEIAVENPGGCSRGIAYAAANGMEIVTRPLSVRLLDDGSTHHVLVRLG
jgi:cyclic beta-1,2-glucan synthetase